jgi:hypothetical protein
MIEQDGPHQKVGQVYHECGKKKRRLHALCENRVFKEGLGVRPHRPKIKDRESNSERIDNCLHPISCNNFMLVYKFTQSLRDKQGGSGSGSGLTLSIQDKKGIVMPPQGGIQT